MKRRAKEHSPRRRLACIEHLESRRLLSLSLLPPQTPLNFTKIIVDPTPGATPLEKTLTDVDGDGRLDIVVGFNTGAGPGGVVWYQNPHSGNLTDKWNRYTIASPGGSSYEDMQAYDLEGTGAMDIIASYGGQIVWFENPRNTGGDPTAGPWPMHVIGPDVGHEIVLADFNGDGKIDVATRLHIYFQNSPTSWTTLPSADYGNHSEDGTAAFDSGSGLGAVDIAGTSIDGLWIGWYENPRDHGGNAMTDVWQFHAIAPAYTSETDAGLTYSCMDVNGDGRMDILTAQNERGSSNVPAPGGLIWWEAPTDRVNGTWIKHTIDGSLQDVHRVTLADMNHDGRTDIVFTEQEQSAQKRVGILYNADGTGLNWNEQILSTDSGHNQSVGDVNNDGNLDILNVPHGVYTGYNPIQLYINNTGATPTAPLINTSPSNQSTVTHGSATFTVAATEVGAQLSYQWRRNGVPISGATGASYTLTNASLADSGAVFDVVVTNSVGTATSTSATLTVTTPPAPAATYLDAGSSSAAGSYLADADFVGGFTYSTTNAIDTSAVTNPAPQAAYQTSRYGNFIYTIPNLNPGAAYTVRLHFADSYATAAGVRVFNVQVNSVPFLTNFDIYAAAGGTNKAITRSIVAIADGFGRITLGFASVANSAQVNAIDVTPYTAATPVINGLRNVTLTETSPQYTAQGQFADNGPGPWTATVNYGDGSATQALALAADNTFTLSHTYNSNTNHSYTVTVALTDTSNNASATATAIVSTLNVGPSRLSFVGGPTYSIPVGSSLSLNGSFYDPGAGNGDTYTQTNDFGDSTSQTLNITTSSITVQHTYTTAGVYTLHTTITDAGGGSTDVRETIIVGNPTQASTTNLLINAGGSATGSYIADADYSGGTAYSVGNTIDTSAVTNPAPQAAYQTERYGNFTYTIPSLTAGATYVVRLHFAENYWTAAGQRLFNVAINGTQVLTNFDIYATAGARYKAITQSFNAVANSSGQIVLTFSNVKDNAKVSAIDITSSPQPTVTITAPSAITAPTATLTAAASETGVSGFTYAWSIVGNPTTPPTLGTTTGATLTPTFHALGTYTFQVTATDPSGRTVTTYATMTATAPAWLTASSAAFWNPSTHVLTVNGTASIVSDPGADAPIVQASGSSAVVSISPATNQHIHLGGLSLSNGAAVKFVSLGAARSSSKVGLLVLGVPNSAAAPVFSIDSTSTLDLADNDMAVLYGNGSSPLSTITSLLASASDNHLWDLPGLTSSSASASGYALGDGESSSLGLSSFDGESLGSNAVLVKYTLPGDADLSGNVDLTDYTTVTRHLGQSGASWTSGNFDYSGTVNLSDYTQVVRNLGRTAFP